MPDSTLSEIAAASTVEARDDDHLYIVRDVGGTPTSHAATARSVSLSNTTFETRTPTAADDLTQGYVMGSRWVNLVTKFEYICVSNATNGAVWNRIVTDTALSDANDNLNINGGYF